MRGKVVSLLLPEVIEILVGPLRDGPVHAVHEALVGMARQALHLHESRKRNVDSPTC